MSPPDKSPPESPPPPAADSGADSSTSSPYVEPGGGPGFDPGQAPPDVPLPDDAGAGFAEEWKDEQVSDWLKNAGALAHASFGVGEHDWEMTAKDLERIAPPATRILNRYEPTRAIAKLSDPAAVAMGFGLYGWRSALERIAVLEQQARQEGGAIAPTPAPAPPPPAAAPAPPPAPDAFTVDLSNGGAPTLAADRLAAMRHQGPPPATS